MRQISSKSVRTRLSNDLLNEECLTTKFTQYRNLIILISTETLNLKLESTKQIKCDYYKTFKFSFYKNLKFSNNNIYSF